MPHDVRYWFPAKRYGWEWGLPITWEGWVVLLAFFGLVIAGFVVVPPRRSIVGFVGYIVVLSIVIAALCAQRSGPAA